VNKLLIILLTLVLIRNGVPYQAMVPDKLFYFGIQQDREVRLIVKKTPINKIIRTKKGPLRFTQYRLNIGWEWVKLCGN
jgi:hypothetical protein